MNICPITYHQCRGKYSQEGLKRLNRRLKNLEVLPYTAAEQLREAASRAPKMSIQGVQPKLSLRLNIKKGEFEIVDTGGVYILKPQNPQFEQIPENEDVSMRLAEAAGIDVPIHGLIYSKDGSLTYFIKRFDRKGRKEKLAVEDFAQLLGYSRETKYDASMEKVASVVEQFCTFPMVEKIKLFRLTLVNFLIGNEDMHLKNFSLITRGGKIELSPAYDILNSTIVLTSPKEETALPIAGKRRKLSGKIMIDYFGRERLGLNRHVADSVLEDIHKAIKEWRDLLNVCFLSDDLKEKYSDLLNERIRLIF